MPLRVMTWNLWWRFGPWERRQHAIVDTIRRVDPDVLCLQEVWVDGEDDLASVIAAGTGRQVVRGATIGGGFANAVVTRWPLEPLADLALPGRDGTPGHRRVVATRVATPWGPWPIASTHLDHRFDASGTRQLQAQRLLELAADWRGDPATDLPLIIGGDLNAVPDSDEIRLLTGRRPGVDGIVLSDAWEQCGASAGHTWRRENPYTADSAWPNRRIDYVMTTWPRPKPVGNPLAAFLAGVGPVEVEGVDVWPSDHAAVVVDIATPD